jgi:hypothetical protein
MDYKIMIYQEDHQNYRRKSVIREHGIFSAENSFWFSI